MNKRFGMSAIGFAIVLVIIFGFVMIISAPNFIQNDDNDSAKSKDNDNFLDVQAIENRFNMRIDELENRINNFNSKVESNNISDKFVCKIDGKIDESGNTLPADSDLETKKFIFVCEYNN